ncbi:MAG: ATP-grasp domain-containing protein [Cyclobacterium sp.]|uniref:ATP-grasp domain-containing protein n=1 Tax=Cyclobacterium sp. TaxID=1966343 RepID=UPI0039709CD7
MKRKLINVLIPDTESGHTMAVVRCLKGFTEIKLHGCSFDPKSPFRYSLYKESFTTLTDKGKESYIKDLLALVESKNIDVILPIDEDSYRFFASHKKVFQANTKLATLSTEGALAIATNKYKLAKFCELHGVPAPKTEYLNDLMELNQVNQQSFRYPVIVKPETGWGGKNVHKLFKKEEVEAIKPLSDPKQGTYIVQEFIEGYDIDMSFLAKNGEILAHTIQKGFLKRSNRFAAAAGVQFLKNEAVYNGVEKLVNKLNFSGIAHVDLRYDQKEGDFKIIEINARYWGSLIASHLSGVNFPFLHILAALDEDLPPVTFQPIRYMDFVSVIKMRKKIFSVKKSADFNWKDTDLKFILSDPLAEIYNAWKRRIR